MRGEVSGDAAHDQQQHGRLGVRRRIDRVDAMEQRQDAAAGHKRQRKSEGGADADWREGFADDQRRRGCASRCER